MSKIFDLINELCPKGVEFRELGEIGCLYGGLSGKTKDDFVKHGNAKYITYMNVFLNLSIDTNALEYVKIDDDEKQNLVVYGDILFTGSSETRNECGFSSVFTKNIEEPIYLNSFCFGFRLNDLNLFDPEFLKYIFRSNFLRTQIIKTASGVTRFNVSKTKFLKIKLPVPPMEVQREIVRILDSFTLLTAELTAELTARKKQYEFYRDFLLRFESGVNFEKLGEAFTRIRGTPITANKMKEIEVPGGNIRIFAGGKTVIDTTLDKISNPNITRMPSIIVQSRGIIDFIYYDKPFTFKNEMWGYTSEDAISVKFLYYYLKNNIRYFRCASAGMGALPQISLSVTEDFKIPILSDETNYKVVDILDKFDTLVNSITEGLPREIELRRKQYEYYREKLLDFTELKKEI